MYRSLLVLAVVLVAVAVASPAMATTWNASQDFALATNPNGAWSYEAQSWDAVTTPLIPLTSFSSNNTPTQLPGYAETTWNAGGGAIRENTTGAAIDLAGIGTYCEASQLLLEGNSDGNKVRVVWTAPTAMTVSVAAIFTAQSYNDPTYGVGSAWAASHLPGLIGTGSHVFIYKNWTSNSSTALWTGTIQGFVGGGGHDAITPATATGSYADTISVAAGDKLSFVASSIFGYGAQQNVGLNLVISSPDVPEPDSILLLGSGLLGIAGLIRRRR